MIFRSFIRFIQAAWGRTGFGSRTLWDWMGLMFVPLFIAGAAAFLSFLESERSAERARLQEESDRNRGQQSVLENYIQVMTELLLKENLATSQPDDLVRQIARSNTLSAVRQLDNARKGILLGFLYESNLIGTLIEKGDEATEPIVLLSGGDLRNADLSGDDLRGAYLVKADLRGADLGGANLSEANLSEADLREADLRNANLSEADLRNANLSEANLFGVNLRGANLFEADLRKANLLEADLQGAKLRGANLFEAVVSGADLSRADLRADLKDSDLRNANLSEADLRGANLLEADLRESDLTRADLTEADLSEADLRNANLSEANLRGANLRGANLSEANLRGTNLSGVNNLTPDQLCATKTMNGVTGLASEVIGDINELCSDLVEK